MNVKGIGNQIGVSGYQKVARNTVSKTEEVRAKDRIEISSMAKALNDYSLDPASYDNTKKIAEIKNSIQAGTYTVDAKKVAEGMINYMKELNK